MLPRAEFVQHVRDALDDLHNPARLEANPLARANLLPGRPPAISAAQGLRQALCEAIEALRPGADTPQDGPEWLAYELLRDRYVRNASHVSTCDRLGLSRATYYRRLQELSDALAAILWQWYRGPAAGEGPQDEPSPAERARAEAIRLARAAQPTQLNLHQVLQGVLETVAPLARQEGITLSLRAPSVLPVVHGDPATFRHILLNILTEGLNLAATPELEIVIAQEGSQLHCRLRRLKPDALVDGATEGVAGLAVSRGLLEIGGGHLWFDAEEAGGPALHFTISVASPRAVLIIDDDSDTVSLYRRFLEVHGYHLWEARSGEQAWAILAENQPDAILLDVLMPREDGWGILQRLKTQPETAAIPVIICSVLSQPRLALALGAQAVLCKPITADRMLEALRQLLDPSGTEAPGYPTEP